MTEIETKGDSRSLEIEKKNKTHTLQKAYENEDLLKDKKLKSVLNEGEDEVEVFSKDKKLKSVLVEDVDEEFSKDEKLKSVLNEGEDEDEVFSKDKKSKSALNEDEDGEFSKDNKLKSVLNEDEDKKGKGDDGNITKKVKKKKRKHEVNGNEPKSKVKSKKETSPSSGTKPKKPKTEGDNLVRGKRFTPEEDEILKDAVLHYIELHDLGEEGLEMVLNCKSYPWMSNCWKEIALCIPYRPYTAMYYRAHTLFERSETSKWTKEETEFLQECYEKHGNNWKLAAKELGKNRIHVKDKWRRIKLTNRKGGKWSQEEYQKLYDLVNTNLQVKMVSQEKRSKHGMLRDNIPWGVISDKLTTRNDSTCCQKWYKQLTSSLVAEDKWSNADDYRLIKALYDLDAACVEDVDWDGVLEHRPGDVCRKRWDQMVLHIGHHGSKPFSEQVEILSERYCPDLAETREAWDSKPFTE